MDILQKLGQCAPIAIGSVLMLKAKLVPHWVRGACYRTSPCCSLYRVCFRIQTAARLTRFRRIPHTQVVLRDASALLDYRWRAAVQWVN